MTPTEQAALDRLKRIAAGDECIGLDGVQRRTQLEMDLNSAAAAMFSTPAGEQFFAWLKSITINNVMGPAAPDSTLRHVEGQRFIVALIQKRIEHGRRKSEPAARRQSRVRKPAAAAS